MDEKLLAAIVEYNTVVKDLSSTQNKQFILFCKTIIRVIIILSITTVIAISCLFYSIYQSYNYEGYPETQIENTNVGGDYNGKETKATKTPKINESEVKCNE